jgi:hypothetical protein
MIETPWTAELQQAMLRRAAVAIHPFGVLPPFLFLLLIVFVEREKEVGEAANEVISMQVCRA